MNREIRSYEYVNHPYAAVRDALVKDPAGVLRAATNAAVSRGSAVAAALHVNIGPLDIGAGIAVTVRGDQRADPRRTAFTGHADPGRMVGRAARLAVPNHERRIVGLSADVNGNPARFSGQLRTAAGDRRRRARCNSGASHRRGVGPSSRRRRCELSTRAPAVVRGTELERPPELQSTASSRTPQLGHFYSPVRLTSLGLVSSEGRRPSDSPTRALARRCAGSLRSRGSLASSRSRGSPLAVYEIAVASRPLDSPRIHLEG